MLHHWHEMSRSPEKSGYVKRHGVALSEIFGWQNAPVLVRIRSVSRSCVLCVAVGRTVILVDRLVLLSGKDVRSLL